MLRCLAAHDKYPAQYSNLAFFVATTEHYYPQYADRCQCMQADASCEDYTDRTHQANKLDNKYRAYRIYDTRSPPTPRPTPAPKVFPTMNYTSVGLGQCLQYRYVPDYNGQHPNFLTDPRDPRWDGADRKRECMLRCLSAHKHMPAEYSNQYFTVSTKEYHPSYKDKCQCAKAGASCEDYTDRSYQTNKVDNRYMTYRIYDTRSEPTLRPTPIPPLSPMMGYEKIGAGGCMAFKYLPSGGMHTYLLSDPRDPRWDGADRKRECMLRCLAAHDEAPDTYSKLAFFVITSTWHSSYKDRCVCVKAGHGCEEPEERSTNTRRIHGRPANNFESYRIVNTYALGGEAATGGV
jgi:hypothetical protein